MRKSYFIIIFLLAFSPGAMYHNPVAEKGIIYLTFDDGPQQGSENVNDVVLKEKIKVDVFLVGKYALLSDANMDNYELYAENPYVERCNHSFTHGNMHYELFYLNPLNAYDDFALNGYMLQLNNTICRLPGCNTWRLPQRSYSATKPGNKTADLLAANGARIFGWDLQWDYSPKTNTPLQTPDEMIALVDSLMSYKRTFTPGHIVISCNDQMFKHSAQKLQLFEFIGKLKATGSYRFEHLSKYPNAGVIFESREVAD
jgi:peptidoglycan/xylan/chitin deacetylase (PgdA/CDA1 family)